MWMPFQVLFYQPIYNLFVGFYHVIPDLGIVIIVVTLLIKIVLYPLTAKSIRAQKSLSELQPKLESIKKEHKGDQQKIAQETMKLYKEHKVNPLGSCLPILIQMPVLFAMFYVLRDGFDPASFRFLYSFISPPESINSVSLGFFDLSERSVVLALLAGGAQFWQSRMMTTKKPPKGVGEGAKDENLMAMMNKQMLYFMPVITVIIGMQFPAGLALYWFLSTLFTAIQQWLLFKKKKSDGGPIEGQLVL
ncbi:MAG TPA: hypothetical protein DCY48_03580 [Candidatus Magasanikbacteria bacterium]|nr:hypothetical protein [Candidatus Magasanikbacteria bacterium]